MAKRTPYSQDPQSRTEALKQALEGHTVDRTPQETERAASQVDPRKKYSKPRETHQSPSQVSKSSSLAERDLDEMINHFETNAAVEEHKRRANRQAAAKRAQAARTSQSHQKQVSRPKQSPKPKQSPHPKQTKQLRQKPESQKKSDVSIEPRPGKNGSKKQKHNFFGPLKESWDRTAVGQDFKRFHSEMKGKSFSGKSRYLLAQIGPTTRAIKADPVRRERAYKIIIWLLAILLAMHMLSCINDIMGFTRGSKIRTVTLDSSMTTNQVIGRLDRAGLIKHSTFCKAFIAMTGNLHSGNVKYLPGDYGMSRDMGLENMLIDAQGGTGHESVQLTFPEGYTIDQIADLLERNKVCSREDFFKAADSLSYDYDFLKTVKNRRQRYHVLEGFMYPDTYEFYKGEDARDVVTKMLSNFSRKWTPDYHARAKELGMTVDEVVTLASIIQKEDSNFDNMKVISSVFQNRLHSSLYPYLQSDATSFYVNTYIKPSVSAEKYQRYFDLYSTYKCRGLPVGPIGSPGDDAIKAVLWPDSTGYYFFVHDSEGNLYVSSSQQGYTRFTTNTSQGD